MLKTIAWKEMRELLPAIVASTMLQLFIVVAVFGAWRERTIHVGDIQAVATLLAFESVLFTGLIGLWQTISEKNQGTFLFLLHRPVRREAIIGAKLLSGGSICLIVGVLPLACFALWADSMLGTMGHRAPLQALLWPFSIGILLVYFGAFLSGLRPARWYGSRFLPLLAGIGLFLLVEILAESQSLFVLTVAPLAELCFVIAILHVAMARDYP